MKRWIAGLAVAVVLVAVSGFGQAEAAVVFFDDFNDGNADGWVFPYNSSGSQGPGLWSVEDGVLVQRFFGDANCALVNNLFISNQVVETQMRTAGYAGVVVWYQQVNDAWANYVSVAYNIHRGGMYVAELIDGQGYTYSYGGPWIGNDAYYDLRVAADSATGSLTVYS